MPAAAEQVGIPDAGLAADFVLPGRGLYLDCASQAPRLRSVLAAGHAALDAGAAPWRDGFEARGAALDALRGTLAQLLFEGDAGGLAFVPSAAHGVAIAAHNLPLAAGDAVLVLDGEFPSNLQPWQQRCADAGARLVVARRGPGTGLTEAALAAIAAEPRLRVAALSQAHWRDGALLDLDVVAPALRAAGACLSLDLSQSLGALPVALSRWQPDFITAVGFKWLLGTVGLACLWVAPRWRADGAVPAPHWSGSDPARVWRFEPSSPPPLLGDARRFDAGGLLDTPRIAMAQAAAGWLAGRGVAEVARALGRRTAALGAALSEAGIGEWLPGGHAPHIAALRPPPPLLAPLRAALAAAGIHCTAREELLRIAPHAHVAVDDMRGLAEIAAGVARGQG